jgi:two-component system sensor histidine kinase AgrC
MIKIIYSFVIIIVFSNKYLKVKFLQIFISVFILFFICNISSLFVTSIHSLAGISVESAKNSFPKFLLTIVAMDIMMLIMLVIINTIENLKKIQIPLELKRYYLSNFIPATVIVLLLVLINNYFVSENRSRILDLDDIIIKVVILVLYFVFSIMNLNNIIRLSNKDSELKLQQFYNSKMKTFIDDIYQMKLDFNNSIAKITSFIDLEMWEELELYYRELHISAIFINSTQEIINLKISSPAILGLISSKTKIAAMKNLFFHIEVNGDIDNINAGEYVLCDILGCLMDNAIEAAQESELKHLSMKIEILDGNTSFIIENSYKYKPDINSIFFKGTSTKGEGRGNGLWFIKQKIDREENLILNTYIKNCYFVQELIVKKNDVNNIVGVLNLTELNT